jgi:hypothetical protein
MKRPGIGILLENLGRDEAFELVSDSAEGLQGIQMNHLN